jgi:hypothetical protein
MVPTRSNEGAVGHEMKKRRGLLTVGLRNRFAIGRSYFLGLTVRYPSLSGFSKQPA